MKEPKANLYKSSGELVEEIKLEPRIFGVEFNPTLIAQAVRVYLANQRQGTAHTKTRGDVSGGGKKPWKQKGTGRARQGSTRSPLWTKGGVAHGPKNRDYSLKINKLMRRKALFSALSTKVADKKTFILEGLKLPQIKTQMLVKIFKNLKLEKSKLLVLPETDKTIYLSARNIPEVETVLAGDLNAYVVFKNQNIILLKESLAKLNQVFLAGKKKEENTSIKGKIAKTADRKPRLSKITKKDKPKTSKRPEQGLR
ncbi:50S ribosomal protein L4 [candidate division WWE3 bacterium CG_4_10_14_0_2_um_filter_42_8]|uniref:Large ribosomal subunit protein uL4 n=1 Tax=candidate division WWE3 bacterium CG_4_10_14_0_2_um_filter_42_8 TaxID=1975074 RepID=A0A2M7TCJ2_UNCKA|nr:MAG: 50S ribosomal protein L4 [candidate division WWE3 bacterium CG_4_10_14_0_2_um_filter_42_8]